MQQKLFFSASAVSSAEKGLRSGMRRDNPEAGFLKLA
jgi:hypothetical protein